MKKAITLALIIFVAVAVTSVEARSTIEPKIFLVQPAQNSFLNQVPAEIIFKWRPTIAIRQYSLIIQIQDGTLWKNHLVLPNLTEDNVKVAYNMQTSFRWHVVGMDSRGTMYESPWGMVRYQPGATTSSVTGENALAGGTMVGGQVQNQPKPQFYPVPMTPENNAVLKNFPRNMTFTWLHSTNPQYRNYQLQVDIFHVNSKRWRSELPGRECLLDTMVKNNRFDFEFTADRLGRWRVRGVKSENEVTPWSAWMQFSYRARH